LCGAYQIFFELLQALSFGEFILLCKRSCAERGSLTSNEHVFHEL
jgi:hypothetical protein